jgi:hypothetical protein
MPWAGKGESKVAANAAGVEGGGKVLISQPFMVQADQIIKKNLLFP